MTKRFINATCFEHMGMLLAAELQNTPFVTMSEESNRLRTSNFVKTAKATAGSARRDIATD